MNRLRTSALLSTLLILVVGCGSGASSSSSEPSGAAPAAATEAPASRGGVLPSFAEGAVADLEAWIPDSVAGVKMVKVSMQGSESLLEFDDETISTLLQDLGVSESDVSLAVGIAYAADINSSSRILVFRAAGVSSDRLEAAFKKATDSPRDTPLPWTDATIGGKPVETTVDGDSTYYLYGKGDVLVFTFASDPEIAAEIISGLP